MLRLAFVIDPYPTRGVESFLIERAVSFIDVMEAIQGNEFEPSLISTGYVRTELMKRRPRFSRGFTGSREHLDIFHAQLSEWDDEALGRWRKICDGDETWEQHYERWINSVLKNDFDFDVAVVWGNNTSLVSALANKDKPVISLEMGPVRKPILDTVVYALNKSPTFAGVASYSKSDLLDGERDALGTYELQGRLEAFMGRDLFFEDAEGLWSQEVCELFQGQPMARRILFAGQLNDDTNSISWHHREQVALKELVRLTEECGVQLIVKPHPSVHVIEANERHWDTLRKLWSGKEHVVELSPDFPSKAYPSLLAAVHGVVAGNSSVLFEAMLFDKPVHAMGSVYFVPSDGVLSLQEVVTGNFDRDQYLELVRVIRQRVLEGCAAPLADYTSGQLLRDLIRKYNLQITGEMPASEVLMPVGDRPGLRCPIDTLGVVSGDFEFVDGAEHIVLDDGRRFAIDDESGLGYVDADRYEGSENYLGGWAVARHSLSPCQFFIIPLSANRFLVATSALQRGDVVTALEADQAIMSGFYFRLSITDVPRQNAETTRVFAYTGLGRVYRLSPG